MILKNFLHIFLFFILLIWGYHVVAQSQNVTLLWDYDKLVEIKNNPAYARIVDNCIKKADSYLDLPVLTVMDKTWSFNDDFHFYATMAGYWWPEEINGRTVYVNKDGQTNPEAYDLDARKIKKLSERLQYLSLAYFFSHKKKYYRAYIKLIDAWFINSETYMYPNFEYAQVVPGGKKIRGRAVGLIGAHPFNTLLESVRLISSVKPLGEKRTYSLKSWFSEFADWMYGSDLGQRDRQAMSNQAISYDVTLLNIASYTQKKEIQDELIREFSQKRIRTQIETDGKMPAELTRTNGFSYSLANLRFFAEFCILSNSIGYDIYYPNHERLNSALIYIYQFVTENDKFPYQQIGGWKNAESGFATIIRLFKRVNNRIDEELSVVTYSDIRSISDVSFLLIPLQ